MTDYYSTQPTNSFFHDDSGDDKISALSASWRRLVRHYFPISILISVLLAVYIQIHYPNRLPIFIVTTSLALFTIIWSSHRLVSALPIFPLYILLQALTFVCPLFASEILADRRVDVTTELLNACIMPIVFWFSSLLFSWSSTPLRLGSTRRSPPLSNALKHPGLLPHALLIISIVVTWIFSTSWYWTQLPYYLSKGLLTPLRTVSTLSAMAGSFTGAYAWSRGLLRFPAAWLVLLLIPVVNSIASMLLSSIQATLFAALVGLWLGRSKVAFPLTLATLVLIAFMHAGKAEIREVYWNENPSLRPNAFVIISEWWDASVSSFQDLKELDEDARKGNLFTDRLNNLQNLLFIEQELSEDAPLLNGGSLTIIPQVLLPRVFNPDKVRSQEGQALLNIHFGRQESVGATEDTYIAWGFLAEGVGNFGSFIGPVVMGLCTGFLIRVTENVGRGQLILSCPGLLSLALMVFWITTYEMAASTFFASAFQLTFMVLLIGWWFGRFRTTLLGSS
jgi:hypothetical protein